MRKSDVVADASWSACQRSNEPAVMQVDYDEGEEAEEAVEEGECDEAVKLNFHSSTTSPRLIRSTVTQFPRQIRAR